jgi:small subunit ribosomal protein S16
MVVIRLARAGTKKKPFYHVVVADQRNCRDGKYIEQVGTYDPKKTAHGVSLTLDRIHSWVKNGAQPSETVGHLIRRYEAAQPKA